MLRIGSIAATAALLLSADVSGVIRLRPPDSHRVEFPSSENLPVLPDMSRSSDQGQPTSPSVSATPAKSAEPAEENSVPEKFAKAADGPLQPASRLTLVRYVDGEFARVVAPIPAGKKGFHLKVGAPADEKQLRMALGLFGAAINPGDKAQITNLEFKDHQIIVDINGGGRGKTRLRDRIHMEIGGMPTMTTSGSQAPVNTNAGATVFLDFDKPLPDMNPDDLKQYLSDFLDFSKQHSAAVQWIDTLPPEMQNAIKDKRAEVGMDREMVLAAIGRPDRKVREKSPEGTETEDWIYGKPPAKTVFIKFDGDKVIQVEQFPQ
jgi:hypothetical protein